MEFKHLYITVALLFVFNRSLEVQAAIPTSAGAATREVETTALAAELAASLQKSGNQRASAAIQSMVGQMNPKDQEKYKARMDKFASKSHRPLRNRAPLAG
ncbi:hypothetical protein PCANC_28368 [Puccinia coronata f. sp. avenae]|uniref:RxLR effector protein n=1 Tax=Puccinia coronata f. sp. avenae TaxID=200324 RepID=A0A2N5RV28_9BASI|nr:hypothetical protein PCANC_28368 [Puccinia coronata f. sp. avenae]